MDPLMSDDEREALVASLGANPGAQNRAGQPEA
jgi:hypothetical protein